MQNLERGMLAFRWRGFRRRWCVSPTRFQLASGTVALWVAATLGALVPIWPVDPPGEASSARVSTLDCYHAWTLRRAGIRATAEADPDRASWCWRSALAHQPGDLEALRGWLKTVLADPRGGSPLWIHTPWVADRLVALGGTNLHDLRLIAEALEYAELFEPLATLLSAQTGSLPPDLAETLQRAWFGAGQLHRLDVWRREAAPAPMQPRTEAAYQAYLAGWGPPARARPALDRMLRAWQRSMTAEDRTVRSRWILRVARQRGDTTLHEQALGELIRTHRDRAIDHFHGWQLLAGSGRKPEAVRRAWAWTNAPASPVEALAQARILDELGLAARAGTATREALDQFPAHPGVWIAAARRELAAGRWVELLDLSWRMRLAPRVGERLRPYALALEVRAHDSTGRRHSAALAAEELAFVRFEDDSLCLESVRSLADGGRLDLAADLLDRHRDRFEPGSAWSEAEWDIAVALKNPDRLLTAARRNWESDRSARVARRRLATALLLAGGDARAGLALTSDWVRESPEDPAGRINHALALARSDRPEEARTWLIGIREESMPPDAGQALRLCWAEIWAKLRDRERLLAIAARIDPKRLWITQRLRLEQALATARAPAE